MSSNTGKTKYHQTKSTDGMGNNTDVEAGVGREMKRGCLNMQCLECKGRLLVVLIFAIGVAVPISIVFINIYSCSKSPSNSGILPRSKYFIYQYNIIHLPQSNTLNNDK